MPRAPDDKKTSAEKLYLEGMALVDISKKLGIPEGTVRSWKNRYGWGSTSKKNKCNVAKKPSATLQKKKGAPKGNKNAVGHKNVVPPPDVTKHGGYSSVYWDVLDDEEKGLIEDLPKDEEELLLEQIQLFSVRERRIMKAINKYRNSEQPVAISYTSRNETKRSFDNDADKELYDQKQRQKIEEDKLLPGHSYNVSTQTENKDQIILRLESELSNVQAKKTKAIDALAKLHLEKQRLNGDSKGNDVVRAWAEKVKSMRGESHE